MNGSIDSYDLLVINQNIEEKYLLNLACRFELVSAAIDVAEGSTGDE